MTSPDGYDPRVFPPFAVTVDIVVLTVNDGVLQVVLIERAEEPHKGALALPGGFVREDEDLHTAAARELGEEAGVTPGQLRQLGAYGRPDRDPRMRIVTVGYWTITPRLPQPTAGTDAASARIFPVNQILDDPNALRFDHDLILSDAVEAARSELEASTIAAEFCEPQFTIGDLRSVYEAIWGVRLDQGNFQNKVLEIDGFLTPVGEKRRGGPGRPAALYRAGPADVIDPPLRRPRPPKS